LPSAAVRVLDPTRFEAHAGRASCAPATAVIAVTGRAGEWRPPVALRRGMAAIAVRGVAAPACASDAGDGGRYRETIGPRESSASGGLRDAE
jgi:hypothetical protein